MTGPNIIEVEDSVKIGEYHIIVEDKTEDKVFPGPSEVVDLVNSLGFPGVKEVDSLAKVTILENRNENDSLSKSKGEKVLSKEEELEREKQEVVEGGPPSSRKEFIISCNLEERFEKDNSLSLVQMGRADDYLKDNKGKPKKKNSQEPLLASLV